MKEKLDMSSSRTVIERKASKLFKQQSLEKITRDVMKG